MVYEFVLREERQQVVPVRAPNSEEARKIFDEWYNRHMNGGLKDTTINDLLECGSRGITVRRRDGIFEEVYPLDDIMLPEEKDVPQESELTLTVRYTSPDYGDVLDNYSCITYGKMGKLLHDLHEEYYLYDDPKHFSIHNHVYVYAVRKEK